MPLLTFPWPQILSADGSTYPGAKLFFYETGTSTLATTYTDAALTTPHTNPVIADATGVFPPIYLANKRYKAVLKTAGDVTLFSADPAHEPATPSVATIAAMTAIDSPTNGMTVQVTDLDRGGYFVFDTTSTSAADNGVTFKADDATSGSWVRQYQGGVYLSWFGAAQDGVTDDTTEMQAALNAAGNMGEVIITGRAFCASALTLPRWVRIRGQGIALNTLADTSDMPMLMTNMTSGVFLTCGTADLNDRNAPTFQDIIIHNTSGTWSTSTHTFGGNNCTAVRVVDNVIMNRVKISGFQFGVELTNNCFYARFITTEWLACDYAVRPTVRVYNTDFVDCKSSRTRYFFQPTSDAIAAVNVKMIGGSIEQFYCAFDYCRELAIFGTYFETQTTNAYGLYIGQTINNASLCLHGCTIYMNNIARFVNFAGRTAIGLSAQGNKWVADDASATGTCYYLPSTGNVDIGGDAVTSTFNATYTSGAAGRFGIRVPIGAGSDGLVYSGVGTNGFAFEPLSGAPGSPQNGRIYMADGNTWDPLNKEGTAPYFVCYRSGRWQPLSAEPAVQTTVGAAGGASALPATPTGYAGIFIGGTEYVVPYYAKS